MGYSMGLLTHGRAVNEVRGLNPSWVTTVGWIFQTVGKVFFTEYAIYSKFIYNWWTSNLQTVYMFPLFEVASHVK